MTLRALPTRTVQDLIGLVRSLYFAWLEQGVGPDKLEALIEIGRELRSALELAEQDLPGSSRLEQAWVRAEAATARFGDLIEEQERLSVRVQRVLAEGRRAK